MTTRINGGIITDQMLTGSLRYFIMTAAGTTSNGDAPFKFTLSDGDVGVPGQHVVGWDQTTAGSSTTVASQIIVTNIVVGEGQPVPLSVADRVFLKINERCTIHQVSIVSDTEIHFSLEDAENWEGVGTVSDVEMTAAIVAMGLQGTGLNLPAIPDDTLTAYTDPDPAAPPTLVDGADQVYVGCTYDFSNITIDEVAFELI